MSQLINGIITTKDGYAVKNFMSPNKPPISIGKLSFRSYESAVHYLSNLLYPESYRPYLLAVKDMKPNGDTWDNLMFIGHAQGYYDHETKTFKSARQMDMNAANGIETAYIEALSSTYDSIRSMIKAS